MAVHKRLVYALQTMPCLVVSEADFVPSKAIASENNRRESIEEQRNI